MAMEEMIILPEMFFVIPGFYCKSCLLSPKLAAFVEERATWQESLRLSREW